MALDPIKDYLKKLQSTNPELFKKGSESSLMENVESAMNVSFYDMDSFLRRVSEDTGMDLTEKKNQVQNEQPSVSPSMPGGDPTLSGSDRRTSAVADYRANERTRIKQSALTSYIDVDFLNRSEEEVRVDLEKKLKSKGFDFEETGIANNVKVKAPNGAEMTVDLGYSKKATDRAANAVTEFFKGGIPGMISGITTPSADESMFQMQQAKTLRDFIDSNYSDLTSAYQERFNELPYAGLFEAKEDMVPTRPVELSDGTVLPSTSIPELNKKLAEIEEKLSTVPAFVAPDKSTDARRVRLQKPKERTDLERDRDNIIAAIKETSNNKSAFSKTAADLMNNSGKFDFAAAATNEDMQNELMQVSSAFGIDIADMKLPQIKIDNNPVSFNEFKDFMTDYNLRQSVLDGETSISIENPGAIGPIGELIKEAQALEQVQISGNFLKNIGLGISASAFETIANVTETILDVREMISEAMSMPFAGKDNTRMSASTFFESKKNDLVSKARDIAEAIRGNIPELQGDITDSQSVSELFTKGGQAAADSAIITTTFMLNPAVGLTLTGLDSYGRNLNEAKDIMDYVAKTGDPTGAYTEYAGMTLGKARAIAASKATLETGLTYAFTFNYLKGLSKATRTAGDMTQNELRQQVNFYSKSFYQKYSGLVGKSMINEIPEENLISTGQMFIDEMAGTKNYSIDDYVKNIGNTSISSMFTSLPLTAVAYKTMNNTSKRTVHNLIARGMVDAETMANQINLSLLDNDIVEMQKQGKPVDKTLLDERDRLAKEVVDKQNEYVRQIETNATPAQIVQIAKNEIAIAEKTIQAKREDIGEATRKTYEKAAEDLIKKNTEILESIADEKIKKDALDVVSEKKDRPNQERPGINESTPDKGKSEAEARQASDDIHTRMTDGDSEYFRSEENKEKLNKAIEWLDNITYDSTTEWQRKEISELSRALRKKDNPHVGFERFYNRVIDADAYADKLLAENPTREKISPFTKLEAPTIGAGMPGGTSGIWRMADINHLITIMFKNDRMASVVRSISGRIDANYSSVMSQVDVLRKDYANLSFLGKNVSSSRKKAFNSSESQYERAFIAEAMKSEEGVPTEQAFEQTKARMRNNLDKLRRHDNSENGKLRQKLWSDTYDRLFANASSYADVIRNANPDNVAAIEHLQNIFSEIKGDVFNHMQNYYGNTPTNFLNYLPTFYRTLDGSDYHTDSYSEFENILRGPSTMQETMGVTDLATSDKAMFVENWDELVMRSIENSKAEILLRGDLDAMLGLVNSKKLEDMFDTQKRTTLTQRHSDFEAVRDMFGEKVGKIDKMLQSVGASELMPADIADEFIKTIIKLSTATRLSTISMRTSQASSAMLSTSTIVGNKARGLILNYMTDFASGQLTLKIEGNEGLNAVLSKSATGRRSGTESTAIVRQKAAKSAAETNIAKKAGVGFLSFLQNISDKTLDLTLGQSDMIAGKASFAALYYDRMLQKHPSKVKDMSMDQFWEWSKDNVDMDAITWADSQIARSQMIAASWNNGKMFDPKSTSQKVFSSILFPFGRFAYNRKVGMANDWSILSDRSVATEADKANAKRRLISAATEIAVFKTIQPAVGITLTNLFAKGIGSLVGWDKEFDEDVNMILNSKMPFSKEYESVGLSGFKLSDYERNMTQEVYSALVEGMTPTTMPSVVNDILFSGVNYELQEMGLSDDPLLNVYSKDARDAFGSKPDAKSDSEIVEMIFRNSGMFKMTVEDVSNILIARKAYNDGILPSVIGEDRYIKDSARKAAEALYQARILNIIAPSADLKRFADKLQGKLQRDYTTSVLPEYMKKEGDN